MGVGWGVPGGYELTRRHHPFLPWLLACIVLVGCPRGKQREGAHSRAGQASATALATAAKSSPPAAPPVPSPTGNMRGIPLPSPWTWAGAEPLVSTYAGSTIGWASGTRQTMQFNYLGGLTFDAAGNLYVVDVGRAAVRRITPAGDVIEVVKGGPAFPSFTPHDVAVDRRGNMFITDPLHGIYKAAPSGEMVLFAGGGEGSADGPGTQAKFQQAMAITIDAADNLYVAEFAGHRIRKITAAGDVSTIAGSIAGTADGVGRAAQFDEPQALAMDGDGNLLVAENSNYRLRRMTPAGLVTTINAFPRKNICPDGVAWHKSGVIYATAHGQLYRVTQDGSTAVLSAPSDFATYAEGHVGQTRFHNPRQIAIDAAGDLYISDTNGNTAGTPCAVRKVTLAPGPGS